MSKTLDQNEALKEYMNRFFPQVIKDKDLRLSDIPKDGAETEEILAFGRTIDKRGSNPDHKKLGKLIKPLWLRYEKNGTVSKDLHVLRYLLYAEEPRRRWGFLSKKTYPKWEQYLKDILSAIRSLIKDKEKLAYEVDVKKEKP